MPYGIKLINDLNEAILDEVGFAYYLKSQGRVIRSHTDGDSPDPYNVFGTQVYGADTGYSGGPIGKSNIFYKMFWAAESFTFPGDKSARVNNLWVPAGFVPNPRYDLNDLVFWQIGTVGICWTAHPFLNTTKTGLFQYGGNADYPAGGYAFCLSDRANTAGFNYMVLSPTEPQIPVGNYGMRVFNPSSQKIYDNRFPSASIEQTMIVPGTIVIDILQNNTTHDIVLSRPLPNCYVASPNLNSFMRVSPYVNVVTNVHVLNVAQLNNTTLRLSRKTLAAAGNLPTDSTAGTLRISGTSAGYPGNSGYSAYAFDTVLFVSAGPHP